jgi:hypothetical protein
MSGLSPNMSVVNAKLNIQIPANAITTAWFTARPTPITALSSIDARGPRVQRFAATPLAALVAATPEAAVQLARTVLGSLLALPRDEQDLLLDTLDAWLRTGGSARETAEQMYCHPNTVRHRLHRIAEHTGRAVEHPAEASELATALHALRLLPEVRWTEPGTGSCPESEVRAGSGDPGDRERRQAASGRRRRCKNFRRRTLEIFGRGNLGTWGRVRWSAALGVTPRHRQGRPDVDPGASIVTEHQRQYGIFRPYRDSGRPRRILPLRSAA